MAAPPDARTKRLTLIACIMGSGIVLLDGTVVNVALPTIQRALGGGLAAQQWVVNGYLLTLSSLILVGGSLGDLFGERRVFALGVSGFGLASLACSLSPTIGVLVAMRALQGVAGALLVPSSLAVIVNTFPQDERGAAIGSWTAWGAIAGVLGPLAGGELLAIGSWRWLFVINIPLAIVCVWLILFVVPRAAPRQAGARKVDVPGALLCAAGLAGPVFALIEQPRLGWSSPAVFVPLIAGVILLGAFLWHESRAPDPMLPLGLFKRRNFSAGNIETFSMYAGLAVLFFFLDPVPAADRRLHAAAEWPGDIAGDRDHVRSLAPLRRACRSLRPALLHGRRTARSGLRPVAVPADRHRASTTYPKCSPDCSCSRSASR